MTKIKTPKVTNKRPSKIAEAASPVKKHNAGKVKAAKPIKARNMAANYGVKK